MAENLRSYVEKFILNPSTSTGLLDEEDESQAKVEDIVAEESGEKDGLAISKLRTLNAPSLADSNPKYSSQRVSRKQLGLSLGSDISYSSKTANLLKQNFESEDDISNNSGNMEEDKELIYESDDNDTGNIDFDSGSIHSNGSFESEGESDHSESGVEDGGNVTNIGEVEGEEDESNQLQIQAFGSNDEKFSQKAKAVRSQIDVYNNLFELRIGLHKAISGSNRLPQGECFKDFESDNEQKELLKKARSSIKKLITQLLTLQDTMILSNLETKYIVEECKEQSEQKDLRREDDLNLSKTSNGFKGKKRKVEDLGETFYKRHKLFDEYRKETLEKWYKLSQSLNANRKGGSNFTNFEKSPNQQYRDILSNKEALLKRTQLISLERNNNLSVIGKQQCSAIKDEVASPSYDSEIFDDNDFYSQQVESILHSKMASTKGSDMVAALASVAALRKKASKKKVDTRISKDRRIKFKPIPKLQNYLAPCKYSSMSDDVMNKLFSSLFRQVPSS